MPRYEQYFTDVTTSAKAFIELGLEQHRSVWMNELDMMMMRRRRMMMQSTSSGQFWTNIFIKVPVLDNYLIQVAVLGANSPEWFSCAVGAVMAGGVVSRHNHHHTICHLHHHCHIYHDDHDWSPQQIQQRQSCNS